MFSLEILSLGFRKVIESLLSFYIDKKKVSGCLRYPVVKGYKYGNNLLLSYVLQMADANYEHVFASKAK